MSTNHNSKFGSRLRVGKVLAPHNARPKMLFYKVLYSP